MSLYHESSEKLNKKSLLIPSEILQKISSHFKDDIFTLFSCILVSRNWCTSLIEILWSQPFHLSHSPRIVEIYLSFLPENLRDQLKINFHSFKKGYKCLFDYPSFLKKLSIPLLCNAIGEYLREELNIKTLPFSTINYYTDNIIEQIMYTDLLKLFSKQKHIQITYNFKLFYNKNIIILRELCKLIYNKINVINELDFHIGINFSEEGLKLQLAVEELVKLQDHFRGLKVLTYSGDNEVLCFLVKHCKRIESLKLYQVSYGKNVLNNDDLSIQLISSQKNLRNLEIHDWKISPSSNITSITSPPSITNITTLLQSIQSQVNSLRSIKLINCNFNKCKPLWALSNCLNLEEIIIRENHNFNEKLLIPLTKVKFYNLRKFIYKFQLINFVDDHDDDDEFIEDEFIDLNEIFSRIIFNSKDSLRIISINGFKTLQSLRNTLNSIVECKNLIKLDIMLEKSENTLPLLLSIIKHNQSLEKLYIVSDTRNLANQGNNNNLFIDVNQFLHLFVNLLPQNFKLLKMYTPDWCFNTDTLNQFLEKTKFRIKSMCWVNYECDLDCGEVLRKYAKLNGYKLLFGEDCRFINNSIIKMNVFFEKFITS
ncbi:hypothetical protein RhiirA5_408368 [Rhizophagus irregularis]|uniref:F-box domain-containing protein n=1 Tax=Rhizophagus irregularis TaxID=588596 RepID=A0A2N0Q8A5_9GLOM|nr:hypothetical protein RhiirA5_408368 [Rhizophagus irregularis]CAB5194011.1 unnamed protein product [Rhizophagus irregularis]